MIVTGIPRVYYAGEVVWGWGEVDHFKYELDEEEVLPHITFLEWRWISEYGGHSDNKITKEHVDEFWAPLVITFKKE